MNARRRLVVADTGPLNYLIQMGRVDLLQKLYRQIILPYGVLDELRDPGAPVVVRLWAFDLPEWVEVAQVLETAPSWMDLGLGETEAILLAMGVEADLVLIDDLAGRKAALRVGLKVTGTLSVLGTAARFGLLNLREAVAQLRTLGFRTSEKLVGEILAEFDR